MRSEVETSSPASEQVSSEPRSIVARARHSEHARGLLLIGLFKLTKALLSVALGVGALRLLHHDVTVVALRALDALRIDPESRLVGLIMNKANLIDSHTLRRFSIVTFCYAGLCLIEGTGLIREKRWAEYFTVTLTILALPLECFELVRQVTMLRIGLLVTNLAVLAYLIWFLRRKLGNAQTGAGAAAPEA